MTQLLENASRCISPIIRGLASAPSRALSAGTAIVSASSQAVSALRTRYEALGKNQKNLALAGMIAMPIIIPSALVIGILGSIKALMTFILAIAALAAISSIAVNKYS